MLDIIRSSSSTRETKVKVAQIAIFNSFSYRSAKFVFLPHPIKYLMSMKFAQPNQKKKRALYFLTRFTPQLVIMTRSEVFELVQTFWAWDVLNYPNIRRWHITSNIEMKNRNFATQVKKRHLVILVFYFVLFHCHFGFLVFVDTFPNLPFRV